MPCRRRRRSRHVAPVGHLRLGRRTAAGYVVTGLLALAVALGTAGVAAAIPPDTDFEMPFPCAQSWTGTTRANHSPSSNAVDWNRPDDLGMPVVAAAPGVVTTAVRSGDSGYGNYVVIDHGNGESSLYAHLLSVSVSVSQRVDQGQQIGKVGSTGNSTGPHLHFEEREGRTVVAPWFHQVKFVMGSTLASRNCVDVPLAGNFIGRPPAEVAVFRRAARATFRIMRAGEDPRVIAFGTATDQPVVGDWDGNGRVNVGVRTPSSRSFSLKTPDGVRTVVFGATADLPVAGDWDGNGSWEVGVRRAGSGVFRLRGVDGTVRSVTLGDANDVPVTGDWDGDRRTDLGAYDLETATFTLRMVDDNGVVWVARVRFGNPGDLPVAADWDGNGTTDLGVWDPSTATFRLRRAPAPTATTRTVTTMQFGQPR